MRNRLVELLKNAHDEQKYLTSDKSIQAIADYLLANGVVVPPCKVGDRVYMVIHDKRTKKPIECNVIGFWYTNHEDCCTIHLSRYIDGKLHSTFSVRFTDIGKTVFLTREDAERALKGEKE
jgi:hypothetical protein